MTVSAADFELIRLLLRERTGVALAADKGYFVEARLAALVRETGAADIAGLLARVRAEPGGELAERVVEALLNGETWFFRDHHPFQALRERVLPELRARHPERPVRIWSAACSSGQEAYTLAMIVRTRFEEAAWTGFRILASDCAERALARARRGLYTHLEVNRGLPAPMLVGWFEARGMDFQLVEPIRRMVELRRINVARPLPELPPQDVILLRNVLIYFEPAAAREVLDRVGAVLAPDGWLMLGAAETTLHLDPDGWERVSFGKTSLYRRR